jgi:SRSO17 transposase
MHSRFACLRVRIAHHDIWRKEPHPEQWLLIEWPTGEKEPTKYWLANLPESISLRRLVLLAKQRWIVERDYQELKQELGLGHFEGRGWRGFHHHASLCIAACGFPVRELRHMAAQTGRLPEGHLQVAKITGAALATPYSRSNGSHHNPPGSAGGYLVW